MRIVERGIDVIILFTITIKPKFKMNKKTFGEQMFPNEVAYL